LDALNFYIVELETIPR